MWRELGDVDELASALDSRGWPLVYDSRDNTRALEAFEQSLELRRELGDAAGVARALVGIAQVLVARGETERAEAIAYDLLDRTAGDARTVHFAYHFLADYALSAEGRALAFDDAVELALRDDTQPATPESASGDRKTRSVRPPRRGRLASAVTVPPSASALADGGELLG